MKISIIVALILGLIIGAGVVNLVSPGSVTVTTTVTQNQKVSETSVSTVVTTIMETTTIKPEYPLTVVDALGRMIEISKKPVRVVSLSPAITEELYALGLGKYVVGVDSFSDYPPEVVKLRNEGKIVDVGGYWQPNFEKIVEIEPDLVVADTGAHIKFREKFSELGLTVVYVKGGAASSLEDVLSDIGLLAQIFHIEEVAKNISLKIKEQIGSIERELLSKNVSKVKVLILLGPPSWGYWSAGSGTFINYVVKVSGGYNIASKYHGWIKLSAEDILLENPDVIVVSMMGSPGEAKKVIDEIFSSELSQTNAVKKGNVYVLIGDANNILVRPSPRIVEAVKLMAQILHSEVFGEVSREDVIKASPQLTSLVAQTVYVG